TEADEKALETSTGFKTKMEKALLADAVATSIGAVFGTSNTTTYIESAAGISEGGRTGLTSVVTAVCFIISAFFATYISAIPLAATTPALVIVGIMMMSSFADVKWTDMEEALPAFFAGMYMAFSYSISDGIATAFIFYCIVKLFKREIKSTHPILWVSTLLFILNFVLHAVITK
ncbi:MAG: NCS2 family permease, partial [Clostridiales bacterium]|nr:NCS2 family permease [Clostridiales bacterium]